MSLQTSAPYSPFPLQTGTGPSRLSATYTEAPLQSEPAKPRKHIPSTQRGLEVAAAIAAAAEADRNLDVFIIGDYEQLYINENLPFPFPFPESSAISPANTSVNVNIDLMSTTPSPYSLLLKIIPPSRLLGSNSNGDPNAAAVAAITAAAAAASASASDVLSDRVTRSQRPIDSSSLTLPADPDGFTFAIQFEPNHPQSSAPDLQSSPVPLQLPLSSVQFRLSSARVKTYFDNLVCSGRLGRIVTKALPTYRVERQGMYRVNIEEVFIPGKYKKNKVWLYTQRNYTQAINSLFPRVLDHDQDLRSRADDLSRKRRLPGDPDDRGTIHDSEQGGHSPGNLVTLRSLPAQAATLAVAVTVATAAASSSSSSLSAPPSAAAQRPSKKAKPTPNRKVKESNRLYVSDSDSAGDAYSDSDDDDSFSPSVASASSSSSSSSADSAHGSPSRSAFSYDPKWELMEWVKRASPHLGRRGLRFYGFSSWRMWHLFCLASIPDEWGLVIDYPDPLGNGISPSKSIPAKQAWQEFIEVRTVLFQILEASRKLNDALKRSEQHQSQSQPQSQAQAQSTASVIALGGPLNLSANTASASSLGPSTAAVDCANPMDLAVGQSLSLPLSASGPDIAYPGPSQSAAPKPLESIQSPLRVASTLSLPSSAPSPSPPAAAPAAFAGAGPAIDFAALTAAAQSAAAAALTSALAATSSGYKGITQNFYIFMGNCNNPSFGCETFATPAALAPTLNANSSSPPAGGSGAANKDNSAI